MDILTYITLALGALGGVIAIGVLLKYTGVGDIFSFIISIFSTLGNFIRSFFNYIFTGAPKPLRLIFFIVILFLFGWVISAFLGLGYFCVDNQPYKANDFLSALGAYTLSLEGVGQRHMYMGKITAPIKENFFSGYFGSLWAIFSGRGEDKIRNYTSVDSNILSYGEELGISRYPQSVYLLMNPEFDTRQILSSINGRPQLLYFKICRWLGYEEDDPLTGMCFIKTDCESQIGSPGVFAPVADITLYFYDTQYGKEVNIHFPNYKQSKKRLSDWCTYNENYADDAVEVIIGDASGFVYNGVWFRLDYYANERGDAVGFVEEMGDQFDPQEFLADFDIEKVDNDGIIRVGCSDNKPTVLFAGIPVFDFKIIAIFVFGYMLVSIVNFFRR